MNPQLPPASLATQVARRIRLLRKRQRATLKQVADAAGLTPSYLSLIERGLRRPPLSLYDALATALHVDPLTFFPRSTRRKARTSTLDHLITIELSRLRRPLPRPAPVLPSCKLAAIVARHIVHLRAQRGFTQTQLASSARLCTSYLSMLERNLRIPSLHTVDRIAAALDVDPLVLFTPPPLTRR